MSDTILTIDDITFERFEVPEEIDVGGDQVVSIKRQIGGVKRVDALGPDDAPLEWSGQFRGPTAQDRFRALDAKRKAGKSVKVTWAGFAYTALIVSLKGRYQRFYEIPYRITLEVITDDAAPVTEGTQVDAGEMVGVDEGFAVDLAEQVGDPLLTARMFDLDAAISAVPKIAQAATSQLSSILTPISAARNRVGTLIDAAETVLGSVQAVGGVIPGLNNADLSAGLLGQLYAMEDAANLYDLDAHLGRMATNLQSIGSSGAEVYVAGGDLFTMAAQAYGRADEWSTIAKANGLTDPVLQGIQTILIPPTPRGDGGVLTD